MRQIRVLVFMIFGLFLSFNGFSQGVHRDLETNKYSEINKVPEGSYQIQVINGGEKVFAPRDKDTFVRQVR